MKNYYNFKLTLVALFTVLIVNAQGPNAPEAMSFEPVDATDMVNLVTGDFSYVLPLLNVPSPEGGYPLALSYHGGIAMDQEASWVGLGWSLNPGAITRGVNGTPDDWGLTNVDDFFYDEGWTDRYYSVDIGVGIKDLADVGVGLSWGSNQSLGGYVSFGFGFKNTPLSYKAQIGTDGFSMGVGTNSYGINLGTGGIKIGVGIKGYNVDVGSEGIRVSKGPVTLNYNHSSGLSGGISIPLNIYSVGLGINFRSGKTNKSLSVMGMSISVSGGSKVSSEDYNIDVNSIGISIPTHIFYIGFNYTQVDYSLFKLTNNYTSGALYPSESNIQGLTPYNKENYYMDVDLVQRFDRGQVYKHLVKSDFQFETNTISLPAYDSYNVNAQGLNASLRPYIHSQLNLSGRGTEYEEDDPNNISIKYLNNRYITIDIDGYGIVDNNKVNFTINGAYNSFLRNETSNFLINYSATNNLTKYYTSPTHTFSNTTSLNADNKKREAHDIITYTNSELLSSNVVGFIEAKNIDRSNTDYFPSEGIGAYQITTPDGKTYHYSLPVYNFEILSKSFKEKDEEDKNFYDYNQSKPYATHWLLTAITGPDYVDNAPLGLGKEDYGYWVEFDYGKWSDGYVWRNPVEGYNELEDVNDATKKTYSYTIGIKQLYYLDAIKTRTHTALFVKDIRKDNTSVNLGTQFYQTPASGGVISADNIKKFINPKEFYSLSPGSIVYKCNNPYTLPNYDIILKEYNIGISYSSINTDDCKYIHSESRGYYIETPDIYQLYLKKIILLNNIKFNDINKFSATFSLNSNTTYFRVNKFYSNVTARVSYNKDDAYGLVKDTNLGDYFIGNCQKTYGNQYGNNVLDISDIAGLNLESQADQVIDFGYDYSLAKGTPNSDDTNKGRLSLSKVDFKGKGGATFTPPYTFKYNNPEVYYDKNKIDDWGYYQDRNEVWSLNEITTPIGTKINVNYGYDDYYAEAAYNEEKIFSNIYVKLNKSTTSTTPYYLKDIEVFFTTGTDVSTYFKNGDLVNFYYDYFSQSAEDQLKHSSISLKVSDVSNNYLKLSSCRGDFYLLSLISFSSNIYFGGAYGSYCGQPSSLGVYCYKYPKIGSIRHNEILQNQWTTETTGRVGGGLRVGSIKVSDGTNAIASTDYDYYTPETGYYVSSGITSFAPSRVKPKGIPYVSLLPPPMVMYKNVKMIQKDGSGKVLNGTEYEFETLERRKDEEGTIFSLGDAFKVQMVQNDVSSNVQLNKVNIINNLSILGRLKSIKTRNAKDQVLSRTQNKYKDNLNQDGEIGVTQESFVSYKRVFRNYNDEEKYYVSSTSKIDYPSVLESTTTTQGGFTSTTYFDKYDFLTGQLLETRTYGSDGTAFKTKVVPAYTKYPDMGSKVDDINNKNMLTQETASYAYLWDKVENKWKITGVGITTWNNEWKYYNRHNPVPSFMPLEEVTDNKQKIWRKHETYVWKGELDSDGALLGFNDVNDDGFVWGLGLPQTNAKWQKTSTITFYDHYSAPIEIKDINGNYASTKYGDGNTKIYATGNAKYTNMYYSGAEDKESDSNWFSGGVRFNTSGASVTNTKFHTGKSSLKVTSNSEAFAVNVEDGGDYKVSVWVDKANYSLVRLYANGMREPKQEEVITAGDWVLLSFYFQANSGDYIYVCVPAISEGQEVYMDDFRVHPIVSSMTSYVYNEWDELTYILGTNNMATHYVYDAGGRLIETYVEVADDAPNGITGGFKLATKNSMKYYTE